MTDAQIAQELALQNQLGRDRVREAGQTTAPDHIAFQRRSDAGEWGPSSPNAFPRAIKKIPMTQHSFANRPS